MARKDPYRTIRIREVILDSLKPLLQRENRNQFRPLSLNAYCEKILWDFTKASGLVPLGGQLPGSHPTDELAVWDALPPRDKPGKRHIRHVIKPHPKGKASNA